MADGGYSPHQAFAQKLKDSLDTIMESYMRILSSTKVQGRDSAERERLQLTTNAASIVSEAQGLLKMITELKLAVLTSNLEGLNRQVDEHNAKFEQEEATANMKLEALQDDVARSLTLLESHYFSSLHR
mmetsp:Transcript_1987/g.3097  ORF Transcript_1987/g.3097 Transcript_1987/m.3097 type:complete len:129 (+) Transcript_1987:139-525(+)|eukprot:CAMPEP_0171496694 /NCGR_PEP_ID=MMETSP0958-20121227/6849_1 /TAXON_ID=87120 /ORGANISM="Aurantiochytrium limacinum, Strain ATCCMYA-1381" /LENGTH=128 /DNA_ID=CAMNT_0012030835 /DNA_START=70 /DNA_END=456 /DNA_ORIENTATION=+